MLMTVHSAKGLEFQNVFLVGMEQGVFPGNRSLDSREDLEEERRLAYVALTRAKKKLTLTTAASRMLFGMTMRNLPSQFLTEIDRQLIEQEASQRQSRPWNFRRQAGIRAVYFAAAADGIGETTEIQGRAERIPCGRTGAPCNLWGRHCSGYHENGK